MRIVALLTVRNEERYLKRCLEHLHNEGIEVCVIDNGSTDKTVEIAESFRDKNVFRIEHFPFNGSFELEPLLIMKENLSYEIDADWFIHYDADEIKQAPKQFSTLKEAIIKVDKLGYNAINFDEFVFLPTVEEPDHEGKDYVKTIRHYYFFGPFPLRRINAWKKFGQKVDIVGSGGHKITFENRKIYPESFILRHYIILSRVHGIAKFCGRVFSEEEVIQKRWHVNRQQCRPDDLILPKASELKEIPDSGNITWDRADAWSTHFFVHEPSPTKLSSYIDRIKRRLNRIYNSLQKKKSLGKNPSNISPIPIIVGANNSGTAHLKLMLDSHPELLISSEILFHLNYGLLKKRNRKNKKKFIKMVINHPHWPKFEISKSNFLKHINKINSFDYSKGLRSFCLLYAEKLGKNRFGEEVRPFDNQIINISSLLPEAKFIHIIRDGRDVAATYKDELGNSDNDIEALATNWVWQISDIRRQSLHTSNYMEIRFEDLINDPRSILSKICEFIELPFSEQMLEYDKKFIKKNTHNGSFDLSKEDQIKFENIAGDMLRDLDYIKA
jgi:glycosyltransferase involved in cell wall biosynthesis